MIQWMSRSEAQTEQSGECLAAAVRPGDVIAFRGGLGMGKTAFTRGLARGLGYAGRVTSPTFTIVNEYSGGRLELFHFDFYRLHNAEELFEIGWDEYLERGGVCVVEWSEQVPDILPPGTIYITLSRCENPSAEGNFPPGFESSSAEGNFPPNENNSPGALFNDSDFLGDSHCRLITLAGLDACPDREIFSGLRKVFPDCRKERFP